MTLHDAMFARRSVRKFKEEKVPSNDINTLLHYAMSGPSACNKCPWEFYVIQNELLLTELRNTTRYSNMGAPLIIVVAGNTKRSLPLQLNSYWIQDCSAAIENILLGAVSLGLGACWCGLLPQKKAVEKVQKLLNIDTRIEPLGLIHIGYADEFPAQRDQYNEKYVHFYD